MIQSTQDLFVRNGRAARVIFERKALRKFRDAAGSDFTGGIVSKEAEDAAIRNFVDSALRAGTIRVTYSAGTLGDDPQAREVLPGGGGAAIRLRPDGSRDIIIAVVRF